MLEAKALAERLGIEHHVADVREEFKQVIVKYFIDEYMRGRTPNPCVMCNPLFKERILCEWADKTNCAYIATGHYCRMEERNGNRYILTGEVITAVWRKETATDIYSQAMTVQKTSHISSGNSLRRYSAE